MHLQHGKPILLICLIAALTVASTQTDSASARLAALQNKIRQSRRSKNWQANVAAAKELQQFLNGSPSSLLETARAELHSGNVPMALQAVEQFVRMGQSSDALERSDEFALLRQASGFQAIRQNMTQNQTTLSVAKTVCELSDPALLPEDIDYDSAAARFLLTSVREKKIVALDAAGHSSDFARAPDNWPMLAIKIDEPHRLVWATEVALDGFIFAPKQNWGDSALVSFNLRDGKLLRRIQGPRGSALGDMTFTSAGDVIVSDGSGGGVYRLARNGSTLERIDAGDFISPQTPTMHPDGSHVFVPDYVRGIGILSLATKKTRWLSSRRLFALAGIDGLYYHEGALIAVQNGASPERVVASRLNAAGDTILSQRVIERATRTLGDPTHGVIVGSSFYYIANSGWDIVDDHGELKPGARFSPSRLMEAPAT